MKIKTDFVTNSSSTCFVVIHNDEFTLSNFVKAIGIDDNSIFIDIYQKLFQIFEKKMIPVRDFVKSDRWRTKNQTFEDYIYVIFSENTLKRILDAEQKGFKVYMGRLSSEENEIESFFCTDSFIIDSNDLFVDGTNCEW